MSTIKLSDMPSNEPVKSDIELDFVRAKFGGIIKSGDIHKLREGGMIQVVHMLCEEVAQLKEEIKQLKK